VTSVQRVGFATGATPTFLNVMNVPLANFKTVMARLHASTVFLDLRRIKSVSLNANCALPVRFQEKNKLNLASHANPIKLLVIYLALLSVHDAQQDRLP
jgi:hypothetical protein